MAFTFPAMNTKLLSLQPHPKAFSKHSLTRKEFNHFFNLKFPALINTISICTKHMPRVSKELIWDPLHIPPIHIFRFFNYNGWGLSAQRCGRAASAPQLLHVCCSSGNWRLGHQQSYRSWFHHRYVVWGHFGHFTLIEIVI